jgi:flagellar L-ring protein precursor FlgH
MRFAAIGKFGFLLVLVAATGGSARADSLYNAAQFRPLTSDQRALLKGDPLTVQIYETSSAQASAETATDRSNQVNLAVKGTNYTHSGSLNTGMQFDGTGRIQRSGKLLALITVRVLDIEPGGLLVVGGEQEILLNGEKQEIKVRGKLRPGDIGENNTVPSTKLAEAQISYIGDGVLGDEQRPGWLHRFLVRLGVL